MIDTQRLRRLVRNFKFYARQSNTNESSNCTVKDLNNVVNNLANVLELFIEEIENSQNGR